MPQLVTPDRSTLRSKARNLFSSQSRNNTANDKNFYQRQLGWLKTKTQNVQAIRNARGKVETWDEFDRKLESGEINVEKKKPSSVYRSELNSARSSAQTPREVWTPASSAGGPRPPVSILRKAAKGTVAALPPTPSPLTISEGNAAGQGQGGDVPGAMPFVPVPPPEDPWDDSVPFRDWMPTNNLNPHPYMYGLNKHHHVKGYTGFKPGDQCKEVLKFHEQRDGLKYKKDFIDISTNMTAVYGGTPTNPVPKVGVSVETYRYDPRVYEHVINTDRTAFRQKNDMSEYVEANAKMSLLTTTKRPPPKK